MRDYFEELAADFGAIMTAYLMMMGLSIFGLMGFYWGFYAGVAWFMVVSALLTALHRWAQSCEEMEDKASA